MKKVAIMTWYQHRNYGTILQAAAMIYSIKKLGYDAKGINYISSGYDRQTTLEKITSVKKIQDGIKHKVTAGRYKPVVDEKKQSCFDSFISEYIPMERKTQTSSQLFQLNQEYDAFICGSDQIWTPLAYNSKYFLDFVSCDGKKIAYAPSFGVSSITDSSVRKLIGKQLDHFEHLSVREKQGAAMIKSYYGKHAEVVLDPTLLLNSSEWDGFTTDKSLPQNTLLCYILGDDERSWKHIDLLAEKTGFKVKVIPVHPKDYHRGYDLLNGVGPAEFISAIKSADLVCTDSFHGTVFSILYHRNFITFKRFADNDSKSQNSRVINLLSMLKLTDHLWNGTYKKVTTDWKAIEKTLTDKRGKSLSFLTEALKSATECVEGDSTVITNTCCGCGICSTICPQKAITMELVQGFYKPTINKAICIHCGLCKKVCAYNGENGNDLLNSKLFEAKSTSKDVLKTSTSGGIAYELTRLLSSLDYPIYGCIYDTDSAEVKHIKATSDDKKQLSKFQGSKYLPSNFFDHLLSIINEDKGVIIGTPCQIAAVNNYLSIKKKRDSFVLIDLICHGVPSIKLWERYLKDNHIKKTTIKEVRFRDSSKGWKKKYIYIKHSDGELSHSEERDSFYHFFDLQSCYMGSCYECNYRTSSKADIRLGDYWGKKHSQEDLELGVSMVSVFTEKGMTYLNQLASLGRISLNEMPIQDYYNGQGPINPIIPLYYDDLLSDLTQNSDTLSSLMHKHFYIKYMNKKMQSVKAKIRRIISR